MSRIVVVIWLAALMTGAAWAQPAAPASVGEAVEALQASQTALERGGLRNQANELSAVAEALGQGGDTVSQAQVERLAELHGSFARLITMYSGVGNTARVELLEAQQAQIGAVLGYLQSVAVAPAPRATVVGGGQGEMNIELALVSPGQSAPQRAARRAPARRPAPQAQGDPMAGGFGPPPMTGDPMAGGYAPPMVRMTGPGAGKILSITVAEAGEQFTTVGTFSNFLRSSAGQFAGSAIVFHVEPDVPWQDVQQVVQAVYTAPLQGPMSFAGLDLRQVAPAASASPSVPDAPAMPAAPAESVSPPAAPAAAPTAPAPAPVNEWETREDPTTWTDDPPVSAPMPGAGGGMGAPPGGLTMMGMAPLFPPQQLRKTEDGQFPAAMPAMVQGAQRVLFALDIRGPHFADMRDLIYRQTGLLGSNAQFAIITINAVGRTEEVIGWTPADPMGRQRALQALKQQSGGNRAGLVSVMGLATRYLPQADALVLAFEGEDLRQGPGLDRLGKVFHDHGKLRKSFIVIGPVDSTLTAMLDYVSQSSKGAWTHLSAQQLADVARGQ